MLRRPSGHASAASLLLIAALALLAALAISMLGRELSAGYHALGASDAGPQKPAPAGRRQALKSFQSG